MPHRSFIFLCELVIRLIKLLGRLLFHPGSVQARNGLFHEDGRYHPVTAFFFANFVIGFLGGEVIRGRRSARIEEVYPSPLLVI